MGRQLRVELVEDDIEELPDYTTWNVVDHEDTVVASIFFFNEKLAQDPDWADESVLRLHFRVEGE